jgi:multiple sugar transport system substrate-binding protein
MRSRRVVAAAVAAAAVVALAACGQGGGSGSGSSSGPAEHSTDCTNKLVHPEAPTVTVWSWYVNAQFAVDQFNNAHTDVQACWRNVGAGVDEYNKFQTAISAKKGAPDVVMLEADHLTSYVIQDAVVDISKYGANDLKGNFPEGAWKDVTAGDAVYAIPVDTGPMAMIYRTDVFKKYGLTPPKTWDEYAQDAAKLKAAGGPLFGNLASNGQARLMALQIQKGATPWSYDYSADPKKLGINLNDQASKDVLAYWGDLVKKKEIGTQDEFTTDFISGLVGGDYATYISAAWAPGYLIGAGVGKDGKASDFAVAPLPQWDPANPVEVNWGGSTFAVTTQANDKALAAEVAKGLYSDKATLDNTWQNQILYPINNSVQNDPAFLNAKIDFFGGQQSNKQVYVPAAKAYKGVVYGPVTPYYFSAIQESIAAVNGGADASTTLDALQAKMLAYAKTQGFTTG